MDHIEVNILIPWFAMKISAYSLNNILLDKKYCIFVYNDTLCVYISVSESKLARRDRKNLNFQSKNSLLTFSPLETKLHATENILDKNFLNFFFGFLTMERSHTSEYLKAVNLFSNPFLPKRDDNVQNVSFEVICR